MLTKDILFGMNILTLAGFVVMGLSLSLNRTGQIGAPLSVGLMCAGRLWCFLGCMRGASLGERFALGARLEVSFEGPKRHPRNGLGLGDKIELIPGTCFVSA